MTLCRESAEDVLEKIVPEVDDKLDKDRPFVAVFYASRSQQSHFRGVANGVSHFAAHAEKQFDSRTCLA